MISINSSLTLHTSVNINIRSVLAVAIAAVEIIHN